MSKINDTIVQYAHDFPMQLGEVTVRQQNKKPNCRYKIADRTGCQQH